MEAFGSTNNYLRFTILEAAVNGAKGALESFVAPMRPDRFLVYARTAVLNNDATAFDAAMAPLRDVSTRMSQKG